VEVNREAGEIGGPWFVLVSFGVLAGDIAKRIE